MNRATRGSAPTAAMVRQVQVDGDASPPRQVLARPRNRPVFNGVKTFAATKYGDRAVLGDRVTEWMTNHPELEVVDIVITQSSDDAYHCLTMTVFYWRDAARPATTSR